MNLNSVICYVINLDRDELRWSLMKSQLDPLNIKYQRISAKVGASLSNEEIALHRNQKEQQLTPNEIGCLLSHANALKLFSQASYQYALILEDDVHISQHLINLLKNMPIPEDTHFIIKLEASPESVSVKVPIKYRIGRYKIHELKSLHAGAAAYLLNRSTANLLSDVFQNASIPVDWALFDPKQAMVAGVKLYQAVPSPFIQDAFVKNRSKLNLQSSIGDRLTVASHKKNVVKQILKPLYFFVVSIYLRSSGIKRTRVSFF